jgi:hypothetical protein
MLTCCSCTREAIPGARWHLASQPCQSSNAASLSSSTAAPLIKGTSGLLRPTPLQHLQLQPQAPQQRLALYRVVRQGLTAGCTPAWWSADHTTNTNTAVAALGRKTRDEQPRGPRLPRRLLSPLVPQCALQLLQLHKLKHSRGRAQAAEPSASAMSVAGLLMQLPCRLSRQTHKAGPGMLAAQGCVCGHLLLPPRTRWDLHSHPAV